MAFDGEQVRLMGYEGYASDEESSVPDAIEGPHNRMEASRGEASVLGEASVSAEVPAGQPDEDSDMDIDHLFGGIGGIAPSLAAVRLRLREGKVYTPEEHGRLEEFFSKMSKQMRQIIKGVETFERNHALLHASLRRNMQYLEGFLPQPYGDWGFLHRNCHDEAVFLVRNLTTVYGQSAHAAPNFPREAWAVARLVLEESVHLCLAGAEDVHVRGALCAVALTMREFEVKLLPTELRCYHLFGHFSEEFLRSMIPRVVRQSFAMKDLPGYAEAVASEVLKHEVTSLMYLRCDAAASTRLSRNEVKAMLRFNGVKPRGEVPGEEGEGFFEAQIKAEEVAWLEADVPTLEAEDATQQLEEEVPTVPADEEEVRTVLADAVLSEPEDGQMVVVEDSQLPDPDL